MLSDEETKRLMELVFTKIISGEKIINVDEMLMHEYLNFIRSDGEIEGTEQNGFYEGLFSKKDVGESFEGFKTMLEVARENKALSEDKFIEGMSYLYEFGVTKSKSAVINKGAIFVKDYHIVGFQNRHLNALRTIYLSKNRSIPDFNNAINEWIEYNIILNLRKKYSPKDFSILRDKIINKATSNDKASDNGAQSNNSSKKDKDANHLTLDSETGNERFNNLLHGVKNVVGRQYYYVWWIFENKEDLETIRKSHKYPRLRGKVMAKYSEIKNKDINEALLGTKGNSDVTAWFLGARGLRPRNVPWSNTVELPDIDDEARNGLLSTINSEDRDKKPVIALGVARAKKWSLRAREIRGITKGAKLRYDASELKWNWTAWLGKLNGSDNKGSISVKVVHADKKYDNNYSFDTIKSLEDVKVSCNTMTDKTTEAGVVFTPLELNDSYTISVSVPKYHAEKIENIRFENGEHKKEIIIQLHKKHEPVPGEQEIIIIPNSGQNHSALQAPFGMHKAQDGVIGGENAGLSFEAKKKRNVLGLDNKDLFYYFFIIDTAKNVLKWSISYQFSRKFDDPSEFTGNPIRTKKSWRAKSEVAETISILYNVPENTNPGKYRLYSLLLRKNEIPSQVIETLVIQEKAEELKNELWDFNYVDLDIKVGTTTSNVPALTSSTATSKNVKKDLEKEIQQIRNNIEGIAEPIRKEVPNKLLRGNSLRNHSMIWTGNNKEVHRFLELSKELDSFHTTSAQILDKLVREKKVHPDKSKSFIDSWVLLTNVCVNKYLMDCKHRGEEDKKFEKKFNANVKESADDFMKAMNKNWNNYKNYWGTSLPPLNFETFFDRVSKEIDRFNDIVGAK